MGVRKMGKKKLTECPACATKIKKILRKNLSGQTIHIGYKCDNCGFTSNLTSMTPMKYLFVWKDQ